MIGLPLIKHDFGQTGRVITAYASVVKLPVRRCNQAGVRDGWPWWTCAMFNVVEPVNGQAQLSCIWWMPARASSDLLAIPNWKYKTCFDMFWSWPRSYRKNGLTSASQSTRIIQVGPKIYEAKSQMSPDFWRPPVVNEASRFFFVVGQVEILKTMCQFKSPSCFGVVAQKGKFRRLLLISDGGPLSQANLRHLVLEELVSSSQLASAPIVIFARDAVMVRNCWDWGCSSRYDWILHDSC